jgi:hypothetical protein
MTDAELNERIAKARGHDRIEADGIECRCGKTGGQHHRIPDYVNSPAELWGMLSEVWDEAPVWSLIRGAQVNQPSSLRVLPLREQVIEAWLAMMEAKA